MERILCAAIHFDDGVYHPHHEKHGTGIVAAGYRHHEIFALRPKDFKGDERQGFLTSNGRFVDRRDAWKIATEAGQLPKVPSGDAARSLFSEDLY